MFLASPRGTENVPGTAGASVLTADAQISTAVVTLQGMKEGSGTTAGDFIKVYEATGAFKEVKLQQPSEADRQQFASFKAQFCQGLVDNLTGRFTSSVMASAKVLLNDNWPSDELQRILYGDNEVLELTKVVKVPTDRRSSVINQFRILKNGHVLADNEDLDDLQKRLCILPISSAECERGFSSMNQTHTQQRSALQIKTIRDLLFVKLNGLPLEYFPAEHYAGLWIKEGRHSVTDNPSGRAAKKTVLEHHHKLFLSSL